MPILEATSKPLSRAERDQQTRERRIQQRDLATLNERLQGYRGRIGAAAVPGQGHRHIVVRMFAGNREEIAAALGQLPEGVKLHIADCRENPDE